MLEKKNFFYNIYNINMLFIYVKIIYYIIALLIQYIYIWLSKLNFENNNILI